MNVLKIIKINILALIAFPLLLVATVVKLVAKAMEKALLIIGTLLAILGMSLLFEIGKNPESILTGIVALIVMLFLCGLFILLIVWVLTLISAAVMGVITLIIGMVNSLYELVYAGYAGIYHICYEDYCTLEMTPGAKRGGCFVFTLLRVLNRMIVFFATHALKLLVAFTILVIGWCLIRTNTYIQDVFGMGLIAYLKMFPVYEVIRGIVLYVAFLAGFSIVTISLGIEWSEWGEEMSMTTSDYERYIKEIRAGFEEVGNGNLPSGAGMDAKRVERYNHYIDILNYHIRGMDSFLQDIMPIAEKSEDHILRANSGQYITDFYKIVGEINKYGNPVPVEELEKLMPRIDRIEELHKRVEQQIRKMKENREVREKKVALGFFSGCDTIEKLEKRYRALCKTYHPDSEAGDEETFKMMREEYEERKAML